MQKPPMPTPNPMRSSPDINARTTDPRQLAGPQADPMMDQTPGPSNIPTPEQDPGGVGGLQTGNPQEDAAIDALAQIATSMGVPQEVAMQFLDSPQFEEAMQYWDGGGDMGLEMMQYKFAEFAGAGQNDLDSIMGNAGMRPMDQAGMKGDKGGFDMDGNIGDPQAYRNETTAPKGQPAQQTVNPREQMNPRQAMPPKDQSRMKK